MIEQVLIGVIVASLGVFGYSIRALNKKPIERARNEVGQFVADDPKTPEVNEAWEGGKAPKPKKPRAKKTTTTKKK